MHWGLGRLRSRSCDQTGNNCRGHHFCSRGIQIVTVVKWKGWMLNMQRWQSAQDTLAQSGRPLDKLMNKKSDRNGGH